jgi:hypothetical protein
VEEIKSLKPDIRLPVVYLPHLRGYKYTVKKERDLFLLYKKIQNGAFEKDYIRKGFLYMRKCANI